MSHTAKLFTTTGGSQAVRLPMEYRFEGSEVYVRREPTTGDIVLSRRPDSWAGFFELDATTEMLDDFMTEADRSQGAHARDPFESVEA
jgi:antitoxin VapB